MSFEVNYDGGYAPNSLQILFDVYSFEHIDPQKGKSLEEYIESNYPEEYEEFKEYRRKVEAKTPNIKQMYFDYLDGKADMPDFEYFSVL